MSVRDPVKIIWHGFDVEGNPVPYTNNENSAGFPVVNLGDRNWHSRYKVPITTTTMITFDLGAARNNIDFLVFFGHNFKYIHGQPTQSNIGYIDLATSNADDAQLTGTLEWWITGAYPPNHPSAYGEFTDANTQYGLPGLWLLPMESTPTASARRYWQPRIIGPKASDNDPYYKQTAWGGCLVSPSLAFTATPALSRNLNSRFGLDLTDVRGRVWTNEVHGRKNAWKLHWPDIPDSEKVEYFEFWDHIHGGLYPFLMQDTTGEIHWVRVIPSMARSGVDYAESKYLNWDIPLHVEEEL